MQGPANSIGIMQENASGQNAIGRHYLKVVLLVVFFALTVFLPRLLISETVETDVGRPMWYLVGGIFLIIAVASLATLHFGSTVRDSHRRSLYTLDVLIVIFAVWGVVAGIYSIYRQDSIFRAISYAIIYMLCRVACFDFSKKDWLLTFGLLSKCCDVVMIITLAMIAKDPSLAFTDSTSYGVLGSTGRLAGLFGNPNVLGGFILAGMCIYLVCNAIQSGSYWKLAIRLLIGFALLVYTESRGSLMGAGVLVTIILGIRIWNIFSRKAGKKFSFTDLLTTAMFVSSLAGSLVLSWSILNPVDINLLLFRRGHQVSILTRLDMWGYVWDMISVRYPLIGVGLGATYDFNLFRLRTHNSAMEALLGAGFPGFIIYVSMMVYIIWLGLKRFLQYRKSNPLIGKLHATCLACACALIANSMTENSLDSPLRSEFCIFYIIVFFSALTYPDGGGVINQTISLKTSPKQT